MNGLKEVVRAEVRLHDTTDLCNTMKKGRKVEDKNCVMGLEGVGLKESLGQWIIGSL